MNEGINYSKEDNNIFIIDYENTGETLYNSQWSDGLH
jgi:preprotein translocase subunit SecA